MFVDVERKFPNEKRKKKKIKTIGQVDSAANNVTDNIADTDRTSAMRRRGDELDFFNDRATFVETKEFDYWRHALFFRPGRQQCHPHYNALVVDVSTVAGNDLELTCISLVKEFIALNQGYDDDDGEGEEALDDYDDDDKDKNRKVVVIVKSASLHNLARRLCHAQKVISGAQPLLPQEQVGGTSIIGTVGVDQYRDTIPFVVKEGDVCVEIGCHFGTTTTLIDQAARGANSGGGGGCLGVDVGPNIISSAKKKYPHLSFQVGDGFKTGQIGRMRDEHFISSGTANSSLNRNTIPTYDVVYVDIGGLSGSEGLLEAVSLLSSISNSWEPRCIVIKSLCIRRLASCLVPFSDVWRKEKLKERELLNEDNR